MRRTPLYAEHIRAGGQMVPFAGFEMPVQYKGAGLEVEHNATRTAAGLFDVSHMGEVVVQGPGATALVDALVTADVRGLDEGAATYALLCHPNGGVVDDLYVYRLGAERYLLVINASNIEKDVAHMRAHCAEPARIENRSDDFAQIALQGPAAAAILDAVAPGEATGLPRNQIRVHDFEGASLLVATTGYTGEAGYEIYTPPAVAEALWRALLRAGEPSGLRPVGLGARDTLRLEMAYALYGHELRDDINPYEARVGWAVKLDGRSFVGSDALARIKAEGAARRLCGLRMIDRGIARAGYPVLHEGVAVGEVTSGTQSPTLGAPIAVALLPRALSKIGTEVAVDVRGRSRRAVVTGLPFLKR
ncbi:MAG: glycine cleavage system aminomethyltransferase GcvT [Deltaproteobacteria bacterium]|nr:glycine cleavage system aminomethyltransferase GcvT [Deltaproteobacteria bacterium]